MRLVFLTFLILATPQLALSQENEEDDEIVVRPAVSLHAGSFLPNQIDGLDEIQPVWGFRYSHPMWGAQLETGVALSRGEGVEFADLTASYRKDIPVEDLLMLAYIGGDVFYYSAPGEDFKTDFGAHVGGGFLTTLLPNLFFRIDMKFQLNPGTSLYVGFGFELKFPGGDDNEE